MKLRFRDFYDRLLKVGSRCTIQRRARAHLRGGSTCTVPPGSRQGGVYDGYQRAVRRDKKSGMLWLLNTIGSLSPRPQVRLRATLPSIATESRLWFHYRRHIFGLLTISVASSRPSPRRTAAGPSLRRFPRTSSSRRTASRRAMRSSRRLL